MMHAPASRSAAVQAQPDALLDLDHLGRQTSGDHELATEVLALFVDQARRIQVEIGPANLSKRFHLAHALKGAARAVGAFRLAAGVSALEQKPDDAETLSHLGTLIDEVCERIAAR